MDELEAIRQASDGLEYPSESDVPFDVFRWGAATGSAQDQIVSKVGKGRAIEQVPVEEFFSQLACSDDAERFQELREVLESRLKDLGVFRVGGGEVNVDIYLLGRAANGAWVGLHTASVET